MPDDVFRQHKALFRVATRQREARLQHWKGGWRLAALLAMTLAGSIALADQAASQPTTRPATQRVEASGAARVVRLFHNALKTNQMFQASRHLAQSPEPVRDADRRVKRLGAGLSGGKWDFSIMDVMESGDIAVVLVNEFLKDERKTIDIKPWYMIRQEGEWKLLGKFTDFELKEYGFDEKRLAEYRKLEEWGQKREPELRKELPGCGGC